MLKIYKLILVHKRFKHAKIHWSKLQKKVSATDRALSHFDDFYGSVFGNKWKSIRVALLTQHKYVALVNIFGDSEKTSNKLELQGAINIKALFNLSKEKFKDYLNKNVNMEATLDNKLDFIIKRQESKEIESMYPENAQDNLPEKIFYKEVDQNKASEHHYDERKVSLEEIKEFKKPLEQQIEENYEIDESRVIDFTQGTTGLYDYIPTTQIKGMENWVLESEHYKYYSTNIDFPLEIQMDTDLDFPDTLSLYTYEKGNCSDFISPFNCETGVLSHFLMDGASILPPLVLNIKPGDRVLDACAAPGGKSLLMLQTLYPEILVCNDLQRPDRIRQIMRQYVFDFKDKWIDQNRCIIKNYNALALDEYEKYDKVLVDVPCTIDRHSLFENDNNMFKPGRIKERLKIPELQSGILTNCLRLVKPGGSVVYSTCSLSPIQNDGVVHMALQKAFVEHGLTFIIKDLSLNVRYFYDVFKFENSKNLKYGQLVLPYLPANFGPMYFCKITRK